VNKLNFRIRDMDSLVKILISEVDLVVIDRKMLGDWEARLVVQLIALIFRHN